LDIFEQEYLRTKFKISLFDLEKVRVTKKASLMKVSEAISVL